MKKISLRLVFAIAVVFSLAFGSEAAAGEKKPVIPESLVSFVVVKDYNGKPIHNAGVVMHPVNEKGKQERGGLELKTDVDGKASFDGIPYGKLRIQVLAQGFQTYGEDFDVNKPTMEITVKMKRPSGQYSIYEDHPGDKVPDSGKPKQ
jgi:hypothetical protein